MAAESREMLLTRVKEEVDAYFNVLLADKSLPKQDRLAELDEVLGWLEEKQRAIKQERTDCEHGPGSK